MINRHSQGLDGETFMSEVLGAVESAFQKFQAEIAPLGERLFQMAIWTDVDAQFTAVSLETKPNATAMLESSARFWRERGDEATARQVVAEGFNGNPADFKYAEIIGVQHSWTVGERDVAALPEVVEGLLQRVVSTILEAGVLDAVPLEQPAWIGTSSPRDWYDHVRRIR